MKETTRTGRLKLIGLALGCVIGMAGTARANDPLPGDALAPPVNVNIGTVYDLFSNTGQYKPAYGATIKNSTRFEDNAVVFRYIHTFAVDGYTTGVEVYAPYVWFLNQQKLGVNGLAPSFVFGKGQGHANLKAKSGFDQPEFITFFYPVNTPSGTTVVLSPGIFPPVSSFSKNASVNAGTENVWAGEFDAGFRTVLLGEVGERNISLEVWDDLEIYGTNGHSGVVSPNVYADQIVYPYNYFVSNPIQTASTTHATFREQPTNQIRLYLPVEFNARYAAYITPGLMQSFGGKQTYKLGNGTIYDSGNRTEETQFRIFASALVTPTVEVLGSFYYDIDAHGQQLNRVAQLRLLKFF